MEWKRKFWHKWRKKLNSDHWAVASIKEVNALLETSVVDIKCTREEFEMKLEKMFLAVKVPVKKRKKQELINDVWRKSIDNFSILVESFINRYQQKYFDLEVGFQDLVKMCNNEREREFLELGFIIKKEYERILKMISKPKIFKRYDQCYIDFNQLLVESIKYIEEGKADFEIKKIRILMIDEYQDFSKLFVKLVEAIRSRNEEIKLFCVGDNWQSINRFAGSEDSYYMNFRHNFDNSSTVEVSTNYRSLPYIINVTNEFMLKNEFQGNPAKFFKSGIQKSVMIHDIEGLINNKENEEYLQLFIDEDGNKESKHILKAAYLKQCADIIKQNPTKDVLILHRMNRFINMQLKVFQNKLKKYFDSYGDSNILYDFDRKVSVKTMHSSKGSEADVVIILEAVNGIIPMIHPDNQLFSVFGETPRIVLDDEKKLFYVAMTRAKNELHILTENKIKSDFLIGLW